MERKGGGRGKGVERTRRRTIGERKSDDDDDDDYDFNPLHSRLSFDIITILDEISLTTTSLSLSQRST